MVARSGAMKLLLAALALAGVAATAPAASSSDAFGVMHAVGRIHLAGNTRLCLQVDGGDVFNGAGTSLGVATPGEVEHQEWTVHTDGSVQVSKLPRTRLTVKSCTPLSTGRSPADPFRPIVYDRRR